MLITVGLLSTVLKVFFESFILKQTTNKGEMFMVGFPLLMPATTIIESSSLLESGHFRLLQEQHVFFYS